MNSNNKTLLITTALAVRLLSIAQGLSDTTVTDDTSRIPETDVEFDGFIVEHTHPEFGPQRLLVDQIHANLYTVSFVGHAAYMEMIGTQGWESSAEALVNYLCDLNPELELSLDEFRCSEIGEGFVVYSLASEDELSFDVDSELGQLFFGKFVSNVAGEVDQIVGAVVGDAFEDVVRPLEDAVQSDVIDAVEAAGDQAADQPDDVDSPRAASFRRRAIKFLGTPMGVAACTVAAAAIYFGARALASAINLPEIPEEVLG